MEYINNLRSWREAKYITQTELAGSLGVNKSLICMIENRKANIGIKTKRKIVELYGEDELFKILGESNGNS